MLHEARGLQLGAGARDSGRASNMDERSTGELCEHIHCSTVSSYMLQVRRGELKKRRIRTVIDKESSQIPNPQSRDPGAVPPSGLARALPRCPAAYYRVIANLRTGFLGLRRDFAQIEPKSDLSLT